MSFNSQLKSELCRTGLSPGCCARAEVYGALLLGQQFEKTGIRIVSKHGDFLKRLEALFLLVFGLTMKAEGEVHITESETSSKIYDFFGYGETGVALHLNNAMLESDCCYAAFLRGAFLSAGAVTDPLKSYHLEIVTPRLPLSRELTALMHECGFAPKITLRSGTKVIYFKASESIEDFLTFIGAPISAMTLMETKIEKDLRNRVNRAVNCETGNVARTVEAYARQRVAIERLMASAKWEALPDELRRTADERLSNPEENLTELAQRLGIGRSALNHRLRKLEELGKSI